MRRQRIPDLERLQQRHRGRVERIGAHVGRGGSAFARGSSGRRPTCRPSRASDSARLCPTMPAPRTSTSTCFIALHCRQGSVHRRKPGVHNPRSRFPASAPAAMNVWIKRIVIALAVLLLLAVAAAVWLIASFDPNRYKGVAVEWMKTNRNRTLAINGPIELGIPARGGQAEPAEPLRSRPQRAVRGDRQGRTGGGRAAAALRPRGGGPRGGERRARSAAARCAGQAQHRRPRRRGAAATKEAAPSTPTETTSRPLAFDIDRITLSDVRARIKDDTAKLDGELVLATLATGRIADGVAAPVELGQRRLPPARAQGHARRQDHADARGSPAAR